MDSLYKNNSIVFASHSCTFGYVIHTGPHYAKFRVASWSGYAHIVCHIPITHLPQELSSKFGTKKYKYINRLRASNRFSSRLYDNTQKTRDASI